MRGNVRAFGMWILALAAAALIGSGLALANSDSDQDFPVIPHLPSPPTEVASTVPANGDVNPYGVAFVPRDFPRDGMLAPGDLLVSNFNNSQNLQGTGTSIVRIDENGDQSLFFQGSQGLGLTTALGVLRAGFVLVGNVPSPTGSCTPGPHGQEEGVGQGSLLVIDKNGRLIKALESKRFLDGPWDLTVEDEGDEAQVFVSNVLSGTVTRIDLRLDDGRFEVEKMTVIASGYTHRCDPAALVVGPTGLALNPERDVLYVASTADNAIFAIHDASDTRHDRGMGDLFISDSTHLHGPLAMARAPNGDLLISQGDAVNPDPNQPSEIVEYTRKGDFVDQFSVNPAPGSAFGLAIRPLGDGFVFAAVDDGTNNLDIWVVR